MKINFLVETCLLCHGLSSISDDEIAVAFKKTNANFAWIEKGTLKIGGVDEFVKFRSKLVFNRADDKNLSQYLCGEKDAALTAAATMRICILYGIPAAVSCGIGGIGDAPNRRRSSDFDVIAEKKTMLIATAIKDMMDYDGSFTWLHQHNIEVLGYKSKECNGYIFNSNHYPLDGEFNEQSFIYNKSNLLLVQIPPEKRIIDNHILEKAIEFGKQEARIGKSFHPAVNEFIDRSTNGASSKIQLESILKNVIIAESIFSEI